MPSMGIGDRSAWKDRIEQSSWVDGARWLEDEDGPVEFLEAEPSAYRLSETRQRSVGSGGSPIAKWVGLGAVAVVLLALAIMSRPGDQDGLDQLPTADQQEILQRQLDDAALAEAEAAAEEAGDADESGAAGSDDSDAEASDAENGNAEDGDSEDGDAEDGDIELSVAGSDTPRPIPELREDLPEDLPGVLFSYGANQSVVSIRRGEPQPVETDFLLDDDDVGSGPSGMVQTSPSEVAVFAADQLFSLPASGGLELSELPEGTVLPADDGFLVTLGQDRVRQGYVLGRTDGDSLEADDGIALGDDLEVLGGWRGNALVYQASKVWLLDAAGGSRSVTDGVLIGYNGTHLAMARCDGPGSCRIEVGTPDQPGRRVVPVPETLAGRPLSAWTGAGAVSPDGDRLAIIDHRGAVWLPTWIDLVTGEENTESESVNPESPIEWSPDGRWLAYAFGDDILVWDTEADRHWRIFLDRPISHLAWLDDPEAEGEPADG